MSAAPAAGSALADARPADAPAADPGEAALRQAAIAVGALAAAGGRLLVVCDFDGTLAPILMDPNEPTIVPAAHRALRRLARISSRRPDRLSLAVLSGRTALDVASRVRIGGLTYLGDHGIQGGELPARVAAERLRVTHDPRLAGHEAAARWLSADARARLGDPTWLFVEPKGPSVAFHFRAAPNLAGARVAILGVLDESRAALPPGLRGPRFQQVEGRRIVELRPEGAGAKDDAVERLLARHRSTAALLVGDDRSDAEAFRLVAHERASGRLAASLLLGVHGARETPAELVAAADLILPEPAASAVVLRALARALEAEDRPGG